VSKKPPKNEAQKARGRNGARVRGQTKAKPPKADEDLLAGVEVPPAAEDLNPRQRAFCEHYVRTSNATESARLAGYSGADLTLKSIGSENLSKPAIAAYIAELQKRASAKRILSADERLEILSSIVEGTATGRATFFGEPVTTYPNFGERVRASELISKMRGELSEKKQHEGEVSIRIIRSNKAPSAIGERVED
jgi:phage terminase small subunit